MIFNSIRQLLRTPLKTILFLLLLTASGAFISFGSNLWIINNRNINHYEGIFSTIGTVEQKPSSIKQIEKWDAELKNYRIYNIPQYNEFLPISLLSFDEADYIHKPEKRHYYGSYAPDYELFKHTFYPSVVEITPLEDCTPDKPVRVRIEKVFISNDFIEGTEIWFCNHYILNPEPLYKGKKYMTCLQMNYLHNDTSDYGVEYFPSDIIGSSQYNNNGIPIKDYLSDNSLYYEVTEGFYENATGRRCLEFIKAFDIFVNTHPVTVTNATNLLMPFYNGDVFISEGRDINEEEYISGNKVCLISKQFAHKNNINVGDFLKLQLYYANYKNSASQNFNLDGGSGFNFSLINAQGKTYSVFEDTEYTVIGIYDIEIGADQGNYGIGGNEVIIPMNSVENSDKNNILDYGPMTGNTTSFQIPNGSIERFMTKWEQYGTEELEITFYDKGYSKLKSGLDNMKNMSLVLLIAGIVMIISIMVFYCHIFITKQKLRTAIERSLGMNKRQCTVSLLSGIIIIVLFGSLLGCTVGGFLSKSISAESFDITYYDTSYSSNIANLEISKDYENEYNNTQTVILISVISAGMMIILSILISMYSITVNLKHEPLILLGMRKE